jgi:LmbE family N-acetylglucosaminyl deacetylase/AmiR/NasT family two-component response regulator
MTPPFGAVAFPLVEPHNAVVVIVDAVVSEATQWRNALTQGNGFQVVHLETGAAAVAYLSRNSAIECVICAIDLPDMPGFDVLRITKSVRPSTPVVLISRGPSHPDHPSQAIREGADDMLVTPIDLVALRRRVLELVKEGREQRATRAHTVLAVGAHPDDVEIGVGGTLLRHISEGDRVVHLLLTDGEVGGKRSERVAEAEKSANLIGMTLVRGGLPDAFLSDARESVGVIEQVVAQYSPSVVYTHSQHDSHQDHRATFHAVMSGCRGVPTICAFQSPSSTVEFCPNQFMDIGDYLDAKLAAINLYQSQTMTRVYLAEDMIRATAKYWGRHAAHRLVEPLEVIRQLSS